MVESFYIGAYWGSREEPLKQVRDRILQTLQKLIEIDEQFLNWYEGGSSRKQALETKIEINDEVIENLCLQHVKKGELDKNGFAKMGFLFGVWSGHGNNESSTITFNVGKAFSTPHLSNSCVLTVPFEGAARERLLQMEKAKEIVSILVDIWSPDYAVLTSHQLRDKLGVANRIGLITYQNSIKKLPDVTNRIISEKANNGYWFYVKGTNYDESLSNELLSIKAALNDSR